LSDKAAAVTSTRVMSI